VTGTVFQPVTGTNFPQTGIRIRPARPEEAPALSALALRSKAHWGYEASFLEACREELTLSPDWIARNRVFVLERAGVVAGFASLEERSPDEAELVHLFVEPDAIGRGFGRALLDAAKAAARAAGYGRLVLQGDPNAAAFYRAAGAVQTGTLPGSGLRGVLPGALPGRELPLFRIPIEDP
jgi:GNAT superfamily N-acetyltransferase